VTMYTRIVDGVT